jgi:hypothetical protein
VATMFGEKKRGREEKICGQNSTADFMAKTLLKAKKKLFFKTLKYLYYKKTLKNLLI